MVLEVSIDQVNRFKYLPTRLAIKFLGGVLFVLVQFQFVARQPPLPALLTLEGVRVQVVAHVVIGLNAERKLQSTAGDVHISLLVDTVDV